jgi:hypothetical protein
MNKFIKILIPVVAVIITVWGCTKADSGSATDLSLNGSGGATGTGGSLARFTIVGNYMYVVDNTSLNVFDITNPASTNKVNSVPVGFEIETVYPYQDKLFIGSAFGMFIYSLANPQAPTRLSAAQHLRACDPVVANDTVAYVTVRGGTRCGGVENALLVYNIKVIQSPVQTARIPLSGPFGLGYSGSGLYVCDGNRMMVYDIGNTVNPVLVQSVSAPTGFGAESFYDVIPYGNTLICYVSKGVSFYDISNRLQPVFLSKLVN